jgi:hypothetical protein
MDLDPVHFQKRSWIRKISKRDSQIRSIPKSDFTNAINSQKQDTDPAHIQKKYPDLVFFHMKDTDLVSFKMDITVLSPKLELPLFDLLHFARVFNGLYPLRKPVLSPELELPLFDLLHLARLEVGQVIIVVRYRLHTETKELLTKNGGKIQFCRSTEHF